MDAERWLHLATVFGELVELDDHERRRRLDRRTIGDPELRRQVERLLEADREAAGFLEPLPEPDPDPPFHDRSPEERVGAYRLHRLLGRGGMGTVYLASRDDRPAAPVALKLLPAGVDHPTSLPRFRREGRILARLRHPHIGRLFEHGTTDDGHPYLALEYVDGEPLDEHCHRLALPPEARLRLFLQLCAAVEHAHSRDLVHRDLKPSNVLVTRDGLVKLLDFGIAKPLVAQDHVSTVETVAGHRPMTLLYASPEQLRGLPVDRASDVYSLGVLLYRLLTGDLPHRDAVPGEAERAICEDEPRPPSEAVTGGDDAGDDLRRALAGDLDRIVLKALRKEPGRRYPSAAALAADLERYLDRRPIHRHLEHLAYRLQRTARRHRALLGFLALVAVAAAGAATLAERQAERMAPERRRSAQAVEEMVDLLAAPPELKDGSSGDTARQVMIRAFQRLACRLQGQPREEVQMLDTVAAMAREAGMPDIAWALLTKGVELRRLHLSDDRPGLAATLQSLGEVYLDLADGPAALDPLREALALRRETGAGDDALAATLEALGRAEHSSWRLEEAGEYLRESLDRTAPGAGAGRVRRLRELAGVHRDRGDPSAAAAVYLEARRAAAEGLAAGIGVWQG